MDGKEKRVKLTLKNISKSFYARKEIFEAVNNVSLDVYENEFLVILGPGQCGKSVLLNMITCLLYTSMLDHIIVVESFLFQGTLQICEERVGAGICGPGLETVNIAQRFYRSVGQRRFPFEILSRDIGGISVFPHNGPDPVPCCFARRTVFISVDYTGDRKSTRLNSSHRL